MMPTNIRRSGIFEMIEDAEGDYLSLRGAIVEMWGFHYRGLMRIHQEAIETVDDETDWTLLDTISMIIAKGIYYCDPAKRCKE